MIMKIRYILIIITASIAWYIGAMEMPGRQKRKPRNPPTLAQLKKAREEAPGYSIAYYLKHRPITIAQRMIGQALDLSNLQLNSLEGLHMIPGIYLMEELDLSGNGLTSIPNDSFYGLRELVNLNLANNNIITLEPRAFSTLSNLQQLNLADNKLTRIDVAFGRLFYLQELHLENNNIRKIMPNSFRDQKHLERLWLNNNLLEQVTATMFIDREEKRGLINLKLLSLEGNPVTLSEEEEEAFEDAFPQAIIIF